jgi:peptide/nickel transport system substrate-binding protein
VITLAWRDKLEFRPWPFPGAWREFQEIGFKK